MSEHRTPEEHRNLNEILHQTADYVDALGTLGTVGKAAYDKVRDMVDKPTDSENGGGTGDDA